MLPAIFILVVWVELVVGIESISYSVSVDYPPFTSCENKSEEIPLVRPAAIPHFQINLDNPPESRWNSLILSKRAHMLNLLNSIKRNTAALFGKRIFELVDIYLPRLAETLPQEYYLELKGISKAAKMKLGEIALFNVFYEFFSVCTSIIMEDEKGAMYHGRNLDFGLFLGWDVKNRTWLTTEYLRPLIVTLDFTQTNKTIYSSVHFAGYVGVLTAVKKGKFSLTVNERFKLNGGYVGIIEWAMGNRKLKWIGLLTRDVMLNADKFVTAEKMLAKEPLIAPVYFILAGNKSDEGSVITRSSRGYDIWPIGQVHIGQTQDWFIVQTNYDHWKRVPFYDNRRDPAVKCMEEWGKNTPFKTLKNVLSTRPVLNKLTTYSAIMEVSSGNLYVELQDCKDPCWPW